jgi:hypothetical protein
LPPNSNGIGFSPNEIIDALSIIYIQKMEAQTKKKKKKEKCIGYINFSCGWNPVGKNLLYSADLMALCIRKKDLELHIR